MALNAANQHEKDLRNDSGQELSEMNELGHIQELDRNFGVLSICAFGLVSFWFP